MARFKMPATAPLSTPIKDKWSLVPLRIPGGWAVKHNGIDARWIETGELEMNDSQDLFWAVKLPPPNGEPYASDPTSRWREIHVDAGWYVDRFRIDVLDPDWDHVSASYDTFVPDDFVFRLEACLLAIVNGADPFS